MTNLDLFTAADLAAERMIRIPDHETSIDAAKSVMPCRRVLQQQIINALLVGGPRTAGELEKLERFKHYGPSTVRKRVSELYKDGKIIPNGERRDGMTVWCAL